MNLKILLRNLFEDLGCGSLCILTATQTETVLRIANLVLAIIISLLVLVSRIIDWYKKATADGKITKDEVEELIDIGKDGAKEIKDHIEKDK